MRLRGPNGLGKRLSRQLSAVSQCRLQTLNDEDLHGIKTEEPYGGDKQKKDSVGDQANKDKPIGDKVADIYKVYHDTNAYLQISCTYNELQNLNYNFGFLDKPLPMVGL